MNLNHSNSFNFLKSKYYIGAKGDNCGDSLMNSAGRGKSHDNRLIASLKICSFIMLQSWRKSRNEIKQLNHSMEGLKKCSTQRENQIRTYGTLIRMEQNRTDELTSQLKRTLDNLKYKTACCKSFSITLSNLKINQVLLEQELKKRHEESDALSEVLAQTKKQLFRSMMEQRNLHSQLCKEQRTIQSLENEKEFLVTEICGLNTEHRRVQEDFKKQLKDKEWELIEAKYLLGKGQPTFIDVRKTQNGFVNAQLEIRLPRLHATGLQNNTHRAICQRLGMLWARFIEYPKYTLNYAHKLSYYLLPGMPSPSKIY